MDATTLFPALNGLASLCASLVAVLWFALLGRGWPARQVAPGDRLVQVAGAAALALAGGCGVWASQFLALGGLTLPWALGYRPGWMVGAWCLAVGAMASLIALDHSRGSPGRRLGLQALGLALLWPAMQLMARLSLDTPPSPTWTSSLIGTGLMSATAVAALALMRSERLQALGPLGVRLWLAAGLYGLMYGMCQDMTLAEWTFASVPSALSAGATGAGVVWVLSGAASLILSLGLFGAFVDARSRLQQADLSHSLDAAQERLRQQALADPLTRLPNRLLFEERLDEQLSHLAADAPDSLAVMFIDLDGFKPVNDSYGHAAGDAVLVEIGRRLQGVISERDLAARVGGDEFLLLIDLDRGRALGRASGLAQAVLRAIGEPFVLPNRTQVKLSCSIGIVTYPSHGPGGKLIASADAAMYAAKRAGGSTFAFFEPSMEQDARLQLALQHDLRSAIEQGELELYYQPKVHALSGQVTGAEALVRWNHAHRGLILPGVFIPVAERFGLISPLGYWVIEEACRQIHEWQLKGLRMRVAVNLSMQQLRQDDLVPRIRASLARHRIDPSQLTFEVTESVAMEDATVRALSALAGVGVTLSIDDFGTAYSNFAALRKLPVDQLKIDRSLFTDIGQSADALAVVDAMIKMAHALGLKVVAEGVETERQRDLLLSLACDEFQGYLYARPMSARMLSLWALEDSGEAPHTAEFRPSLYVDGNAMLQ